jgi:Family of unknown function (DUF5946)
MAAATRPGASPACARLYEVTLRGLREETGEPSVAAVVALADAAYDAQHAVPGQPGQTSDALARLTGALGIDHVPPAGPPPSRWRSTIADVAADLDIVDLPALVEAWARGVHQDWSGATSHVPPVDEQDV